MNRLHFIWRAWTYRLRNDPGEIRSLLQHVSPGHTAIDIGAHKGGYTYWMAKSAGPTGRVIAFEPQPTLSGYLKQFFDVPAYRSVTVESMGLSSRKGQARLVIPEDRKAHSPGATLELNPEGNFRSFMVKTDSLDNYCSEHAGIRPIHFMKCDVEGHELEVFKGGETILTEDKPALLFECERRHLKTNSIHDVFRYLTSRGYEGHFFFGRRLLPLCEFDENKHQQTWGSSVYCNNFFFTPAGK